MKNSEIPTCHECGKPITEASVQKPEYTTARINWNSHTIYEHGDYDYGDATYTCANCGSSIEHELFDTDIQWDWM